MDPLIEPCAGLDVHKMTMAVCVRADQTAGQQVRTFGTMTADLLALRDLLTWQGLTHVAMEST